MKQPVTGEASTGVASPDRWRAFVDHDVDALGGPGPLSGVRIAVKDNIAVSGRKWTAGLPLFESRVATIDAPCVAILRAAGARLVGTTATDAAGFGMMTPGVVNPLAPDRTAGGSSGGSAAAVACGLSDAALGTDTGGSVRVPAACCGLYGLKPTFGMIPVDGVTPLSSSCDHVGIIAGDLETLTRVARQLLPALAQTERFPQRIGYDPDRVLGCHLALRDAIERTLCWLDANGHDICPVELPPAEPLAELHGTIVCDEAMRFWRPHWPHDSDRFGDTARRSLSYAQTILPEVVAQARLAWPQACRSIAAAFDSVDAIIGPTIAIPPPIVGARKATYGGVDVPVVYAMLAETCTFNVSGHPALAAPLPWRDAGIPLSLQIATPHGREDQAIALAARLTAMPSSA